MHKGANDVQGVRMKLVIAIGGNALLRRGQELQHVFPAGSMGPKVEAASKFVLATGKKALIGSLDQIEMLEGNAGTEVSAHAAIL